MRVFPLAASLLIGLGGCDLVEDLMPSDGAADTPETSAPAPKAKAKAKKAKTPLEIAIEAQADYIYNPIGKRDPFRSFLSFGRTSDDDTPRTPLQKYEIDQYSLVGIVWGVDRPRALVQDPSGVGHVMEIGTYIGKNWGKVTQISANQVVVTEEYQTIDGELVVNPINLTLPVDEDDRR